ncbi:MAG: thioesterase family protein [Planctomycetia bacterium]|nr:thioesterase family protein [Planctomycetia bacterium]
MTEPNATNADNQGAIPLENVIEFRVRYAETDQMGVVYHANYFAYFEMGRTELLRQTTGVSYRELEESNLMMAVVKLDCSYHKPACYDDWLTLRTRVTRVSRASLEHEYTLFRGSELLAVGHTRMATLEKSTGRVVPVPLWLRQLRRPTLEELGGEKE